MSKKSPDTTETEAKIFIGVPVSDSGAMNAYTAHSIGAAIISAGGLVTDFILRQSCDIVSNRTFLVNAALQTDATHILFIDCDMTFPHDIIKTLLAHEKEIVGVEYNKRKFPLEKVSEPLTEASAELYKVKFAGMGVMLIDLSIFRDPKFGFDSEGKQSAWFNFGRDSEGKLVYGEDGWFSNVARDAGYDTWVDPVPRIGHLGLYSF